MKFILGKKLEMDQLYQTNGEVSPVTWVLVEPNVVVQVKTAEKDGYLGVQLGAQKAKNLNKPQKGHLKDLGDLRYLREFRIEQAEAENFKRGQKLDLSIFAEGEKVKVCGLAKGKGFTGVVKRHGFSGGPATHGHKDQLRMPGSIGCCSFPGRVMKGKRMAGRVGERRVTVKNLKIVKIEKDKNLIALGGALPGKRGGLVMLSDK